MSQTKCCICGTLVPGLPDDDIVCQDCEDANFAGAELHPLARRDARGRLRLVQPPGWWLDARHIDPPRTNGMRVLTFSGRWTWSPEDGVEEVHDGCVEC